MESTKKVNEFDNNMKKMAEEKFPPFPDTPPAVPKLPSIMNVEEMRGTGGATYGDFIKEDAPEPRKSVKSYKSVKSGSGS